MTLKSKVRYLKYLKYFSRTSEYPGKRWIYNTMQNELSWPQGKYGVRDREQMSQLRHETISSNYYVAHVEPSTNPSRWCSRIFRHGNSWTIVKDAKCHSRHCCHHWPSIEVSKSRANSQSQLLLVASMCFDQQITPKDIHGYAPRNGVPHCFAK